MVKNISKTSYFRPPSNKATVKKSFAIIIFAHDIINKVLSHDSNHIVDAVM